MLAAEGYGAVTIGGITNGRPYPDARFFRHRRTYIDSASNTLVTGDPAAA